MIIVHVIITTSEETRENLRGAITALEQATRAESGCLDYTFSIELNDPQKMRITEQWENMEALQAHFTMPHMAAFQAAIADHPPQGFDLKFFEANEVAPPGR